MAIMPNDCVDVTSRYVGDHYIRVGYTTRSLAWNHAELVLVYDGKVHALGSTPDAYATFDTLSKNGRAPRSNGIKTIAKSLRQKAYDAWLLAKGLPKPEVPEVPEVKEPIVTAPTTATPAPSGLESALITAIAGVASDAVLGDVKSKLSDMIAELKRNQPQVHEFQTPQGKREVKGVLHHEFDRICRYVAADKPVYLYGEAGTGKSHTVGQVAEAMGLDYFFCNRVSDVYQLAGHFLPKMNGEDEVVETQFYLAAHNKNDDGTPKECLFFFDETDKSIPDAVASFLTAIAQREFPFPDGVAKLDHIRFVAAGNTALSGADAKYSAAYQQDAAFIDRFKFIEFLYDTNIEEAICDDGDLLAFYRDFRASYTKAGIEFTTSYRGLKDACDLAKVDDLTGRNGVLRSCITKSLDTDDLRIIENGLTVSSTNRWRKALKELVAA